MRILARVGASILIFAGLVAVVAAAVTMKFVGKDDVIMMQPNAIRTKSAVITTAKGLLSVYGSDLHIEVRSKDPKQKLWVAVAYQDDLDSYLGKTSRTEIISYAYPKTLGTYDRGDADGALTAPGGLDWWLAEAKGAGSATLVWRMQNAPCGIVIMNQSGKPKLDTTVTIGLQIKGVYETAELVGAAGIVAILLGVVIFVVTRRRKAKPMVLTGGQP